MQTKAKAKIVFLAIMALIFLSAGSANADTWTQKYLVNKATMKTRNVNAAVQDTAGNKWFHAYESTTSDGFNDSFLYEYTVAGAWVDHTETLRNLVSQNVTWEDSSNWGINSIYADKSGNVWVGATPCTLLKYDGADWSLVSPQTVWEQVLGQSVSGINGGYFYSMFGDESGNLYSVASVSATGIGSQDSVRLIKRSTSGIWSTALPADSVISYANQAKLKGAVSDTNGDFWFYLYYGETTSSGVYRYHGGTWTNYTTTDGLASNFIASLKIDSSGNVWAATHSGVSKFDGASWSVWTKDNSSLLDNNIFQIAEDNSGRIWFTTVKDADYDSVGGAAIFDPVTAEWTYYSVRNANDDFNDVRKIFFLGDDMWSMTTDYSDGFVILSQNDLRATLYGQVSGTIVEKATHKVSASAKSKGSRVKIWKMKQKKKNSSQWKRTKIVYNRRSSGGWYKALNLATGKYYIKVHGKAGQVVDITDGDPRRLNF